MKKLRIAHWWKLNILLLICVIGLCAVTIPATVHSQSEGSDKGGGTTPPSSDTEATPPPGTSETEVTVQKLTPEQMTQFQERLEDLRDRILKSKARLLQLKEQLMLGTISIISLTIQHSQQVGATFRLQTLAYSLDGIEIYNVVTSPENKLEKLESQIIYEGSLLPGEHLLTVDMIFRGRGYGLFSYLNQYLFKVRSRYVFSVKEGDVLKINVIAYDEGSFLTSLKDRLKVKFTRE